MAAALDREGGKPQGSLGFTAANWGLYRRALGLGLVLTVARTPRIAPRMAVRGRGYVAGIGWSPRLGLGAWRGCECARAVMAGTVQAVASVEQAAPAQNAGDAGKGEARH